ncbi:MAG TPA: dolichyl-phosphate beta-D-mannosyltransferase [candidate division Zixibacteria bacterium]|nr:dolichyl-phosphate beta-D-mannosyltransferase [candidate division Zixibacteria bacterium]HBZ01039.1 dolichyl-phosphate beta-D-mannosyltransferase [candidate division Zixibacteria bacterium]
MKNILVCIPTFNERENVEHIIREVLSQGNDIEILIIDDNSPDGTAAIVEGLMKSEPRLHILKRAGKLGLGTAYVDGFTYGLTMPQIGYFMEMDADFSHDPKYLSNFRETIQDFDLVIGSRYSNGISIVNWPISRLLLSYFASKYVRIITGMPIMDPTGGFKCFRREVLEWLDLKRVKSNGYSFQIEMNFFVWRGGFKIKEIPILFIDRRAGTSKMSSGIVKEAVWGVWKLFFRKLIRKDKLARKEIK